MQILCCAEGHGALTKLYRSPISHTHVEKSMISALHSDVCCIKLSAIKLKEETTKEKKKKEMRNGKQELEENSL